MPTAIKFENISKQYRLGLVSTRTLSHDLNRWWKTNVLRQEDPYMKIGDVNDRSQKAESEYVWALRNINFEVEQGDIVGIIGKNGAGKSTLLKILSKVTTPTTGIIKARGRIASLLEVGTGFHPEMTGRENIYMNGAIMGMTRTEISRKLDEIVDFSGVERYIDTPVKRYSSGMTVRLGFAIAAHLDPEILVVDEVLAVGDAEFQKKAIGKMQDVSRGEGRTVLFVSHNMASIKRLCNKSVLLQNGSVFSMGDTQTIVDEYLHLNKENISKRKEEWITSSCLRLKLRTPYFVDKKGNVQDTFVQGEKIIVVFEFQIQDTFKKMVIGVALNDMQDNRILTSHSIDDESFSISHPLKGNVRIECVLNTDFLAPKDYQFFFGVRDESNNNIIKSKEPIRLSIHSIKSIDGAGGVLINAGKWSLK